MPDMQEDGSYYVNKKSRVMGNINSRSEGVRKVLTTAET